MAKVAVWDNLESERPLSPEELGTRMTALEEFEKWSLMEETSWRQKSREIWLKEGDRNTGFFHRIANSHKKSNTIERISDCCPIRVLGELALRAWIFPG